MATIRRRKDSKHFEVQIRRDGWPHLVRTFTSAADARAWASVIESEMERGVLVCSFGPRRIRAVTHLDVSREACERAGEIIVELAEGWAGR